MKDFTFVILALVLFSCNNIQESKPIISTLRFDVKHSSTNRPFFRDSIVIKYYHDDSLSILFYDSTFFIDCEYFNYENMLFEKRYVTNYPADYFGVDTILTFSTRDTTFIYGSKRDDFIVTLIDLSLFNSKYSIIKEGKMYKTIKQSIVDTSYKEIFYYNKNFRIYKFINMWKGDKCVYSLD